MTIYYAVYYLFIQTPNFISQSANSYHWSTYVVQYCIEMSKTLHNTRPVNGIHTNTLCTTGIDGRFTSLIEKVADVKQQCKNTKTDM